MIGGRTSTIGFMAVGVEPYIAAVPEDGPRIWESMEYDRYAVIMVTEPVYKVLREKVPGFPPSGGLPVVLVVPAVTGSQGIGPAGMKDKVQKALGADLEG